MLFYHMILLNIVKEIYVYGTDCLHFYPTKNDKNNRKLGETYVIYFVCVRSVPSVYKDKRGAVFFCFTRL